MANCITLDGAVVEASGVASVVAEPNVVPKFVPVVPTAIVGMRANLARGPAPE